MTVTAGPGIGRSGGGEDPGTTVAAEPSQPPLEGGVAYQIQQLVDACSQCYRRRGPSVGEDDMGYPIWDVAIGGPLLMALVAIVRNS